LVCCFFFFYFEIIKKAATSMQLPTEIINSKNFIF